MKEIQWIGTSYKDLLAFSKDAKQEIGFNLDRLQRGLEACDWKPIPSIGIGVREVRVHLDNEYRVIYIAKYSQSIYVLHCFIKKTQKTNKKDIEIAKQRLKAIRIGR